MRIRQPFCVVVGWLHRVVDVLPDTAPKQTVFRQPARTRAQLKKDQAFKAAQEKRLRR